MSEQTVYELEHPDGNSIPRVCLVGPGRGGGYVSVCFIRISLSSPRAVLVGNSGKKKK